LLYFPCHSFNGGSGEVKGKEGASACLIILQAASGESVEAAFRGDKLAFLWEFLDDLAHFFCLDAGSLCNLTFKTPLGF